MFEHKETLGYLSAQLARLLSNQLREGLVPLGLLPAQFTALIEISAAEGMTQKELVERLGLEQPGVARTLSGLEHFGWIVRRGGKNGRSPGLYLTERARNALPRAAEIAEAIDKRATAELTRTERANLLDQLQELAVELKQA
jgi:DNA-binding MarR family transcriptional regulator